MKIVRLLVLAISAFLCSSAVLALACPPPEADGLAAAKAYHEKNYAKAEPFFKAAYECFLRLAREGRSFSQFSSQELVKLAIQANRPSDDATIQREFLFYKEVQRNVDRESAGILAKTLGEMAEEKGNLPEAYKFYGEAYDLSRNPQLAWRKDRIKALLGGKVATASR